MSMNWKISHLILIIILVIPIGVNAELKHGHGSMWYWTWDFSDSISAVYPDSSEVVDLTMFMTARTTGVDPFSPAEYFVSANTTSGALIAVVPDTTLEDLWTAPEDPAMYTGYIPARTYLTYVVKTVEGHYAKFHFTNLTEDPTPVIEYYYQTDGSRVLKRTIGTENSSWGRIKKVVFPHSE